MGEFLPLGYDKPPKNIRLTHDYLKLFAKLIEPEDIPMVPGEITKIALTKAMGIPLDIHEQDRIFLLEADRGALINPHDKSRNVSFKVETFQLLLKGLEEGIWETVEQKDIVINREFKQKDSDAEQNKENKVKREWFESFLFSAGVKCGEKFGKALRGFWSDTETAKKEEYLGEEAKLRKWCIFDSDVGFGKFGMFSKTLNIIGGKFREGDIILRESFLTPAEDTSFKEKRNHRYCSLMTGYIQGVLSQILDGETKVTHREISEEESQTFFSWEESRSESCVFHVERIPTSE
jgi:hypothetical protein